LSADSATRPIITFLMLHRALQPGYDYLLERKLSSIWREITDSPLRPDLDRFMTAAAELGFTERVRFATGSQVPVRLLIQTGRRLDRLTVADLAAFSAACREREERTGKGHRHYLAAVSTPSGCCSISESSMNCPAQAARFRLPNGWPRSGHRSGTR
jgi:hypothetical protein